MIEGYVGLIGNGKTMLATDHAVRLAHRRKAILAANIGLHPPDELEVPVVQLPVGDDGVDVDALRSLVERARSEGRGLVLLLDELGVVMPARFWQSFPVDLMFVMSQSRKLGVDVIWTSQDVEDVDAYLRRKTQWIHKVRAIPAPTLEKRERGRRPWLFRVTVWRPATVDKSEKRISARWVRYRRSRESWYDTDELVRPAGRLGKGKRSRLPEGHRVAAAAFTALTGTEPAASGAPAVRRTGAPVLVTVDD